MFNFPLPAALAALVIATAPAVAKEVTLKVGDAPPKLAPAKWVQGEAVTAFAKDTAYIVEFWATWCGPCKASIPHLNDIHKKFKDKGLVIIGQDVLEEAGKGVPTFVKQMGDKMTYRVALDDVSDGGDGVMSKTWLDAAGQDGIPTAFVIGKDTKIAWIGHPMELKDAMLEAVLAGTFDAKKAAEAQEKSGAVEQELAEAMEKVTKLVEAEKFDEAMKELEAVSVKVPDEEKSDLDFLRLTILAKKKDVGAATKLATTLSETNKDIEAQNNIAWTLATAFDKDNPFLDLAEKIATKASQGAKDEDAALLDTLARIAFLKGRKNDAIKLEEKAVRKADADLKEELEQTLESFKKGELPPAGQ